MTTLTIRGRAETRGTRANGRAMTDPGQVSYARAQRLAATFRDANVPKIAAALEEAARDGHVDALFELGTWRHHGIGGARDDAAAVAAWARAAQRGHVAARIALANACERGVGMDRDAARAFSLYDRAAEAGDLGALYERGRCRYYGIGTPVSRDLAQNDFARAARFGHAEAVCDAAEADTPRSMPRRDW